MRTNKLRAYRPQNISTDIPLPIKYNIPYFPWSEDPSQRIFPYVYNAEADSLNVSLALIEVSRSNSNANARLAKETRLL